MYVKGEAFLLSYLVDHTGRKRNDCKNLLKYGNVMVNGKVETHHAFPLHPGDIVEVGKKPIASLPFPILYEDDEIIVIDKPSGLVAEETNRNKDKTAYAIVKDYLTKKHEQIFLVHRLDQYTSGVMMFVKTKKLYQELTHNWNNYVTKRGYIAIVEGKPKPKGTIDLYLAEGKSQKVHISNKNQGKRAITHYKTLKTKGPYSMLEVSLDTGRKNQIRVHLSSQGYPIIGDDKYGSTKNPIKRLGLHANEFAFKHPFTKKEMRFKTDIPEAFTKLMQIKK